MASFTEETFTFSNNGQPSKTRYLSAGPVTGPLAILMHGWIGCAETWIPQLNFLAGLGYRVVAPDCRGYGGSTVTAMVSDYSMETHNRDMLALLTHLDRDKAVWIGHDWGALLVWGFAAHYPQHCEAVATLCVPYRAAEFGIDYLASLSDRTIYPEAEYPNAQWDYMAYHNSHPKESAAQIEANPERSMKLLFMPGNPQGMGKPYPSAIMHKLGGWFAGAPEDVPLAITTLAPHPEIFKALTDTIRNNGAAGPNAYYLNFDANKEYVGRSVNDGVLEMPVLFIGAIFDYVCETTANKKICDPMRENCKDLTEKTVEAGHWVALEKSDEVNKILESWLSDKLGLPGAEKGKASSL